MKRGIILIFFILVSIISYSNTINITVDEAINIGLKNNYQLNTVKHEKEIAIYKKEQAKSSYFPKLKLNGGISLLSDVPDLVSMANKMIDLNNAVDASYDMLKLSLGADAQYYGTLAKSDPAKYGEIYNKFKYAFDNASLIAEKMSQKEKYSENLVYYGFKITFEQPLYTGGKITSVNKQAEINSKLSEANIELLENNTVFEIKKSFYTALQAYNLVIAAQEGINSLKKHVEEAKSYYSAGLVPYIDVVRAETKLAEMNQKLITAQNGFNLAKSAFKFTIGDNSDNDYIFIDNSTYTDYKFDLDSLKKEGLLNRPEIKQINYKIELVKLNKDIVKSAEFPLVALMGDFEEKTNEFKWDPRWSISLVGSINIFDGFLTKNQVNESSTLLKQAETAKETVVNSILLDINQAYLTYINSLENINLSKKALKQAEEMLKMAKANYNAGVGTSLEELDAETAYINAKSNLYNAYAQFSISLAQLEKSIGKKGGFLK